MRSDAMVENPKDDRRRAIIEDARRRDVCPQCGKGLGDSRVGSGALSDGVFCSLECLTSFHGEYFQKRGTEGGFSSS